jgi:RimJ/RimL family protein N-acetyltransferase
VFDWNGASARVLEKAGYVLEGRLKKSVTKDGQTIDQLMYAMIRE